MRILAAVAILATLCACGGKTSSRYQRDGQISLSAPVDADHRLALKVQTNGATPGLTSLQVTVRDARDALVRDAIVYAQIGSATGETPTTTVVARNAGETYQLELPLVYGSRWTVVIKAFSGRRSAEVAIDEDLD